MHKSLKILVFKHFNTIMQYEFFSIALLLTLVMDHMKIISFPYNIQEATIWNKKMSYGHVLEPVHADWASPPLDNRKLRENVFVTMKRPKQQDWKG